MSITQESNKYQLSISDIQFLAKMNPKKKETVQIFEILKPFLKQDGFQELPDSTIESLKEISKINGKYLKGITNILNTISEKKNSSSPLDVFIPSEYEKVFKKFTKYTQSKGFLKWMENIQPSEQIEINEDELVSQNISNGLPKIEMIANSFSIHKKIKVFKDSKNSLLNFKFNFKFNSDEIHLYIPSDLESQLSEEGVFIVMVMFLARYLLSQISKEIFNKIEYKLDSYIDFAPEKIKEDMIMFFGKKWEDFFILYYSLKQMQELIYDRLTAFIAGDIDSISNLYRKLNEIKENSYEIDGEIFLIEELWADHNFSKEITSELPDNHIRKHFLNSYKGGYLYGKTIKKIKIWNSHDRKHLKELYL
jgi:hypothetical protein